jgi:prepilin-type N-terminal cleavage/methylation domain-containing protein/prepilin-type processing-associated H-X9-DG protein
MGRNSFGRRARAFTLTELLIVVGLIGLLASLLLPVLVKARSAANGAVCLTRLRQMGTAWAMYTAEHKGRLMEYIWFSPTTPDVAWNGYWPGVLDAYKVRGEAILCPSASEPIPHGQNKGYGNAAYAWTGKYLSSGTVVRFNAATYRESSYGYNRYLVAGGDFGAPWKQVDRISSMNNPSNVPVFFDAAAIDARPVNGSPGSPAEPPPDLRGQGITVGSPEHWKFLLARHGRAVNVSMADGSARRVPLEETYLLGWKADWVEYRLQLPAY